MRILVIEDDATTADYITSGLREEGHAVDLVSDGREALIQATGEGYDVMIVDRMLPGLDGLSLVKALRATRNTTPALFLTSLG
ncbi:MAG: response regulator, partial [Paracoccaceae bacterium]|nr:response regulator [Paracoccaceae bacterium]